MNNALINAADRGFGRGMHGRGFHPVMFLLCLALIGGAIALVVWLIARRRSAPSTAATPSPTTQAEAILAERLARGEIAPDDYRATLAALREPVPSA